MVELGRLVSSTKENYRLKSELEPKEALTSIREFKQNYLLRKTCHS